MLLRMSSYYLKPAELDEKTKLAPGMLVCINKGAWTSKSIIGIIVSINNVDDVATVLWSPKNKNQEAFLTRISMQDAEMRHLEDVFGL